MAKAVEQAAVIPWKDGKICLVTSSSGSRWVIPKGMIGKGHSPAEAAAIEAWEEAGLFGSVAELPLGTFHYEKSKRMHRVTVFLMNVTDVESDWPESFRQRDWVDPGTAIERLTEPDLKKILQEYFVFAMAGN
ncbi:MAG: NUDIX domain-containing protein [Gemmataceae bacterium]